MKPEHVPAREELSKLFEQELTDEDVGLIRRWELSIRKKVAISVGHPIEEPVRWRLPDERPSVTHRFRIRGDPEVKAYLTIGMYPGSKQIGEIFVEVAQEGSFLSGIVDGLATVLSVGLQHGIPMETFSAKFRGSRFEPCGRVEGAPDGVFQSGSMPVATSVIDYIARYCSLRWPGGRYTGV